MYITLIRVIDSNRNKCKSYHISFKFHVSCYMITSGCTVCCLVLPWWLILSRDRYLPVLFSCKWCRWWSCRTCWEDGWLGCGCNSLGVLFSVVHPPVCPSVRPSVRPSVLLSVSLFICDPVHCGWMIHPTAKVSEQWIGSVLLGIGSYNCQPPIAILSPITSHLRHHRRCRQINHLLTVLNLESTFIVWLL